MLTNRGQVKAVFLATVAEVGIIYRPDALDVTVTDDGPPEMDADGLPILSGYGCDRNEW